MDDDKAQLPCHDKLVFMTEKEARAAAALARHRYGGQFRIYQCRHCHCWHIATDYE